MEKLDAGIIFNSCDAIQCLYVFSFLTATLLDVQALPTFLPEVLVCIKWEFHVLCCNVEDKFNLCYFAIESLLKTEICYKLLICEYGFSPKKIKF
jgi:hypothetical protein